MATQTQAYPPELAPRQPGYTGAWVGFGVIVLWLTATAGWLLYAQELPYWVWPLGVLLQTHLYTGLFITAHDAMHGLVAPNKPLNKAIGRVAAGLFAFNWYDRLLPRHHNHHDHVASENDPDYHDGKHPGFWRWYLRFAVQYITLWQILLMAISFNLLKLILPTVPLVVFWIAPSILATFQLFYFGTYLPHKGEHAPDNPHKARSQRPNHLWAFLSCYFFGYHYEHHHYPWLPWWKLPKAAEYHAGSKKSV